MENKDKPSDLGPILVAHLALDSTLEAVLEVRGLTLEAVLEVLGLTLEVVLEVLDIILEDPVLQCLEDRHHPGDH